MKRKKHREFFPLKAIRNMTIIVLVIFFIYSFDGGSPNSVFAFETTGSAMGIEIIPDDELFNVDNMAPGGTAIRRLTVKNTGHDSFNYNVVVEFKEGSKLLFNNLNLKIKNVPSGILKYEGKLRDLKTVRLGVLPRNEQSDLDFTVEFPSESGNEYQRLATSFTLVIGAEQVISEPVPVTPVPTNGPTVTPAITPTIVGLPNTGGTPAQHNQLLRVVDLSQINGLIWIKLGALK